jgi:acid phosphatase family membrane protein YuiD
MLSPYLITIILAWVIAQGTKLLISNVHKWGTFDVRQLYSSGSMPSAHSAAAVALMTIIGLKDGVDSAVFGIITLFTAIILYDAVMVRRSTGEQGSAIQALISELKSKINIPRAAKGHEPLEVAVGALIGLIVGLLVFFVTY